MASLSRSTLVSGTQRASIAGRWPLVRPYILVPLPVGTHGGLAHDSVFWETLIQTPSTPVSTEAADLIYGWTYGSWTRPRAERGATTCRST